MSKAKGEEEKKRGLPKGRTNNPYGRPVGAKNKVPNQVRLLLEDWTVNNFEQFKKDFKELDALERAKLYEKISARFIPRPTSEEEEEANSLFKNELFKRLFGTNDKE